MLIGERPGGDALASRSMSAYLVYRLSDADDTACGGAIQRQSAGAVRVHGDLEYLSARGLPALEAAGVIVEKAAQILLRRAAGNRLEALLKSADPAVAVNECSSSMLLSRRRYRWRQDTDRRNSASRPLPRLCLPHGESGARRPGAEARPECCYRRAVRIAPIGRHTNTSTSAAAYKTS